MSSSTIEIRLPTATNVTVTDESIRVDLADGRSVEAPLGWYPRLSHATPAERGDWRLIGGGQGVHWESLDEDISVPNLLGGQPSMESQSSFKKWLAGRALGKGSP